MKLKVIFLDIDGVLNTLRTQKLPECVVESVGFNQFDKNAVSRINEITNATGAKLVISSTWRIGCVRNQTFSALISHLKQQGITGEVIGYTPILFDPRNAEIDIWLEENGVDVDGYAIIDDDLNYFEGEVNNLVLIDNGWLTGIQPKHVKMAIDTINGQVAKG